MTILRLCSFDFGFLYKHPHDRVSPRNNDFALPFHSLPQSHRHLTNERPPLVGKFSITVKRPCLVPVCNRRLFGIIYPLCTNIQKRLFPGIFLFQNYLRLLTRGDIHTFDKFRFPP
jgi:hypothetical protein